MSRGCEAAGCQLLLSRADARAICRNFSRELPVRIDEGTGGYFVEGVPRGEEGEASVRGWMQIPHEQEEL